MLLVAETFPGDPVDVVTAADLGFTAAVYRGDGGRQPVGRFGPLVRRQPVRGRSLRPTCRRCFAAVLHRSRRCGSVRTILRLFADGAEIERTPRTGGIGVSQFGDKGRASESAAGRTRRLFFDDVRVRPTDDATRFDHREFVSDIRRFPSSRST